MSLNYECYGPTYFVFSSFQIRKMLEASPTKCSFNDCLHIGEPGCVVKGDWERYSYYFQLLDEIKVREEFQLRTFGTKKEGDVRYVKVALYFTVYWVLEHFMVKYFNVSSNIYLATSLSHHCSGEIPLE